MAPTSKRRSHLINANKIRWSKEVIDGSSDESIFSMDIGEEDERLNHSNFKDKIQLYDIGDLFELCKNQCNIRYLSALIYLILRHFNISFQETDTLLKDIGALTAQTAHKWASLFMDGEFDECVTDGRGGKRGDSFYDVYPDLEVDAKAYAVSECGQKAPSFTAYDLALFVDERYYEINSIHKTNSHLVRSVQSCRLDLKYWGARFDTNTNRPYFEGHDRSDVIAHRNEFLHHFLSNKNNYYTVSAGENAYWETPSKSTPTILICKISDFILVSRIFSYCSLGHDESTFRSGEARAKRWLFDDSAPLFNKGNGRSVMVSDFLVQHPAGPFFQLNEKEWLNAVKKFPDLLDETDLRYEKYSATINAHLGVDPYFDNDIILLQFERLFKLVQFKEAFRNHKIEVLVDNARTHTAKQYSINDFGKNSGTRCKISVIEYTDEMNKPKRLDCFFQSGPQKGQSKGLLVLALELGFSVSSNATLDEIKSLLSGHRAFQNVNPRY